MGIEAEKLKKLYSLRSKHSNYQMLPKRLSGIIEANQLEIKSRYERERFNFILEHVDLADKVCLDIGGNAGFFTLELIDNSAQKVDYYEGNSAHAEFVASAIKLLGWKDRVKVNNTYFLFEEVKTETNYDVTLLLNILHHVGDDYDNRKMSMTHAKEKIIKQLNSLAAMTDILIFQLGFNWKGNKNLCLFTNGTKQEMIDYIKAGTSNYWEITKIGVAESREGIISYFDLNEENVKRCDDLGEFLNRPIFIMKSTRCLH